MKKPILAMAMLALLCMGVAANAGNTTIMFDPTEMVAPATYNPGAPAAGDGRIDGPGYANRTYIDGETGGFNAWLSNLGTGEGISHFDLWLQDNASDQAASWGETLWLTNAYSTNIQPFASAGWTASVYTVEDEWGPLWTGRQLITYTADSSAYYLRPGAAQAAFGFTADTNAVVGGNYVIWVGAGTAGDTPNLLYNDSWTYGGDIYDPAFAFQRAITAQAVPEPSSLLVLLSGIGGLGSLLAVRRRRV